MKANTIRPLFVAGLVEQGLGLGGVEGIAFDVWIVKYLVVLRHRSARGLGVTEENRLHHEPLVDRIGDRLPHAQVCQFLAGVVDLDDHLISECLIAVRINLEAGHLRDAVEVGKRHGGEGRELDLAQFQRIVRKRGPTTL